MPVDRDSKSLTISVPEELAAELEAAKLREFAGRTESEMLLELIRRGLERSRKDVTDGRKEI